MRSGMHQVWSALILLICLGMVPTPRVHACADFTAAPNAQWQIATHEGAAWLLTPCGERFWSIGVNVLDGGYPSRLHEGRLSYHWGTFAPDLPTWIHSTRQRLAAWGFNTAGGWSLGPSQLPMPFIANLELGRQSRFVWHDPFRPTMEAEMRTWAQQLVAPYKGNPYRIGYFSDNEIGWWYSALFVYYLQRPPSNHTKHKLTSLLQEHYANDWERFGRDFVPPPGVLSFAALLQSHDVKTHLRPGGTGIQVIRRWTSLVAEAYYRLVQRAIRDADPEALIFGDRLQIYYDPDAVRPMTPYLDALATNYDVDGQDGSLARYYFEGLRQLTQNKPVLVSEWFFAAHENRSGSLNKGHLMTVPTQAERAKGAHAAAQAFAKLPQMLGIHWFQYYDHPFGGRPDGEDYNFGLVDLYDQPYEALTEVFRQVNPRLAALHQEAGHQALHPPARTPFVIPEAQIHLHDRALRDWPKERALVPDLVAPAPEVVFGDVYLAWNQAGLYLATITMDYYDPELLAMEESFPLGEALRFDWGVDAGTGAQRFALYIVPPKVFVKDVQHQTQAHFCRLVHEVCVPVSLASASYFGADSPRITAEVALPWTALGLDGPPAAGTIRVDLAVTSYHRARWMSWSGQPPTDSLHDTTAWHTIRLGGR